MCGRVPSDPARAVLLATPSLPKLATSCEAAGRAKSLGCGRALAELGLAELQAGGGSCPARAGRAMNYGQIDVLDHGTVWPGGAVDAALDSSPFVGPLLVIRMDCGEDIDRFHQPRHRGGHAASCHVILRPIPSP
jgi:hypothetical protein